MNLYARIVASAFLSSISITIYSQTLSLDSCRALALRNNKSLRISEAKVVKAVEEHKAAFTNYLPNFSATATYLHNSRKLGLVSSDDQAALGGALSQIGQGLTGMEQSIAALAQFAYQSTQNTNFLTIAQQMLAASQTKMPDYSGLMDALSPDIRNVYAGAISLTQPLYMGGKITAYDKLTRYAQQLAKSQHHAELQGVILCVDEAYWQVISLSAKVQLADSYVKLLQKLESDVQKMIAEGVATRADGLSVSVKVNEAEMMLTKAENGLAICRMLLDQLCGLPLDKSPKLADEGFELASLPVRKPSENVDADVSIALERRPELQSLDLAMKVYGQKVNITRSEFLPQAVLSANYMISNPSLYNGFEKEFKGMWNVSVALQIPIWHWGEGMHKVRAAKADQQIAALQFEEAREKITLQVNQTRFQVIEAQKKFERAQGNIANAEENLRSAKLGFQEGVIPATATLEAHTAWLQAKMEYLDAQIEQQLTAVYLKKALGQLVAE